jgi:hypothetical protein
MPLVSTLCTSKELDYRNVVIRSDGLCLKRGVGVSTLRTVQIHRWHCLKSSVFRASDYDRGRDFLRCFCLFRARFSFVNGVGVATLGTPIPKRARVYCLNKRCIKLIISDCQLAFHNRSLYFQLG